MGIAISPPLELKITIHHFRAKRESTPAAAAAARHRKIFHQPLGLPGVCTPRAPLNFSIFSRRPRARKLCRAAHFMKNIDGNQSKRAAAGLQTFMRARARGRSNNGAHTKAAARGSPRENKERKKLAVPRSIYSRMRIYTYRRERRAGISIDISTRR